MTQSEKFVKIATENYQALFDFQNEIIKPYLFKDNDAFEWAWQGYQRLFAKIAENDRKFFNDEAERVMVEWLSRDEQWQRLEELANEINNK